MRLKSYRSSSGGLKRDDKVETHVEKSSAPLECVINSARRGSVKSLGLSTTLICDANG